jgi:phage shock protein PspC (stress-responsive transcriptional regulator)
MSATTADTQSADTQSTTANDPRAARRLTRSTDDRMLAGVAGGVARYLNADVTLVRLAFAALTLMSGVGAVLYVAAWLLLPADDEAETAAAAWLARHRDDYR